MTTDAMLGRLFALIHDSPPQTPAEFEADAAIWRTIEAVGEWRGRAGRIIEATTHPNIGIMFREDYGWKLVKDIRDFDPSKEE